MTHNHSFRKVITMVMAVLMLVCSLCVVAPAQEVQAAENWPSVSAKAYCEFKAKGTIYVYKDTGCKTRGTSSPNKTYNAYIEKNDSCRIIKFTSGYLQVSYPTSSGYRTGYIKTKDLFGSVTAPSEKRTSSGTASAYAWPGSASNRWCIEKNDVVYKLFNSGSYTAIIYTAKSGQRAYKFGYVKTTDYTKYCGVVPTGISISPNGVTLTPSSSSKQFNATVTPSNAANKSVTWTIANTNVATVSNGLVKAVGNGSTTLTAKTSNGITTKVNIVVKDFSSGKVSNQVPRYKAYSGVDYTSILKNALNSRKITAKEYNNRIALLTEAKKMVSVVWTAPMTFSTWKSTSLTYNSNSSMLYSGKPDTYTKFVRGCMYTGIPYAANAGGHNTYNVEGWFSLLNNSGLKLSHLEGTVSYLGVTRTSCTYNGIDCSGFVYRSYQKVNGYNLGYLSTSGLLSSSSWKKISASAAMPGDILLQKGHTMIYLGSRNGKICVFESTASCSGTRYYEYSSVSGYSYYKYSGIAK